MNHSQTPLPTSSSAALPSIPVFLLKTKSSPVDAYEELFSNPSHHDRVCFYPHFIPVLLHRFDDAGMIEVGDLLRRRQIGNQEHHWYGGLIFTSQRAVEAFTKLVEDGKPGVGPDDPSSTSWPHLQDIPIYSVGPATTRAIEAIPQQPPLLVLGSDTGSGALLAPYILKDYGERYRHRTSKPPLLFLVGETRRDIIPRTLTDPGLADNARIPVTETVMYGTGVMESFPIDLAQQFETTKDCLARWVVIFSPTGCDSLLRVMGLLNTDTGKVDAKNARDGRTFVATIGPTTRDYLRSLGFEPDVCAESPSPEGVLGGIAAYMAQN